MKFENHFYRVPATEGGMELLNNHLLAGNTALIATHGYARKLIKRNVGYVTLAKNGFRLGYGRRKAFLPAGYLRLVEPGYYI